MDEFEMKVARIEMVTANERGEDIRLTFEFVRQPVSFTFPIFLKSHEFDDTELIRVTRSKLHGIFLQLARQCENWRLTADEYSELARMNVRPSLDSR